MLRISNITLRRGARVVLEGASMNVHPAQKVGLVGPNGSGKSSLFALIRGELHADAGEVSLPPKWILSHVAQETPGIDQPALEFVLDGDVEMREVEHGMRDGSTWRSFTHATTRWAATRRALAPSRCSRAWASTRLRRRGRWPSSRAAGACASTSPAPSCGAPTCCCWTSPPTTSTSTPSC